MYIFKLIYFVVIILNIGKSSCQISDKRLCVDEKCSAPVSRGKTLLNYHSPHVDILSFKLNQDVTVYSKEAGSNTDLWGAEINGKRGYVPKRYIRESKMLGKATILVDTQTEVPSVNTGPLAPSKTLDSYQIIDGTTIHDLSSDITPSTTVTPTLATSSVAFEDKARDIPSPVGAQEGVAKELDVSAVISNVDEIDSDNAKSTQSESKEVVEESASLDVSKNEEVDSSEGLSTNKETAPLSDGLIGGIYSAFSNFEKQGGQDVKTEQNTSSENVDEEATNDNPEAVSNPVSTAVSEKNEMSPSENVSEKEKVLDSGTLPSSSNFVKQTDDASEIEEIPKTLVNDSLDNAQQNVNNENVNRQPSKDFKVDAPILSPYNLEMRTNVVENIIKTNDNVETKSSIQSDTEVNDKQMNPDDQSITANLKSSEAGTNQEVNVPEETTEVQQPEEQKGDEIVERPSAHTTNEAIIQIPFQNIEKLTVVTEADPSIPVAAQPEAHIDESVAVKDPTLSKLDEPSIPAAEKFEEVSLPSSETIKNATTISEAIMQTPVQNIENPILPTEAVTSIPVAAQAGSHIDGSVDVKDPVISNLDEALIPANISMSPSEEQGGSDTSPGLESSESEEDLNRSPTELNPDISTGSNVELEENSNPISGNWFGGYKESTEHEHGTVESELNVENADVDTEEVLESTENPSGVLVDQTQDNVEDQTQDNVEDQSTHEPGFLSNFLQFFRGNDEVTTGDALDEEHSNVWTQDNSAIQSDSCSVTDNQTYFGFNSDIFLYLVTTAVSCIAFLLVYMAMDGTGRQGPLIAKINKLEKDLLVLAKENELLQENQPVKVESALDNDYVDELKNHVVQLQECKYNLETQVSKLSAEVEKQKELEEQIESLEKELETSTEVGMELNRIISEMLDPMNGAEKLKENVEQLQRQLLEQKETISDTQNLLCIKETENEALQLDLSQYQAKTQALEAQLNQLLEKMISIEKEKEEQHHLLQNEISLYKEKYAEIVQKDELLFNEAQLLKSKITEVQRRYELKVREYTILKDEIANVKTLGDGEALEALLDASTSKAQLEQLKSENAKYEAQLKQEQMAKTDMERNYRSLTEQVERLQRVYEETDKEKTEATMKLEVLNNYFKKRESELQEEVLKYKSIFEAKEGAATSSSERIKLMLDEIENYKSQNETLKQEILSQEIDLKSQITVLEKKVHDNWVSARQTERKLEDARQEAAQLRNRLTMRERAFIEERSQIRLQSPIDQNGESALSPHPSLDSPASPPPLFGTNNRDHITKSPPMTVMPPMSGMPFLPPLPGAPFMPPPLPGMPPFMPPPPTVFPGDHRPPPLGRMSSPPPPLNSRYSPDTSAFSPYERNSPSPYDSEYGTTPPVRGYSPFNGRDDRRDYGRHQHSRGNPRNMKGLAMSSGSDQSNESLDKHHRKQSKMV